jgi:hypothetical protein
MFGLATRNPTRDAQNDAARFKTLIVAIEKGLDDFRREAEGLRRRQLRDRDDAGFTLQLLEADDDSQLAARAKSLGSALTLASARLAGLQEHIDLLLSVRNMVTTHAAESAEIEHRA